MKKYVEEFKQILETENKEKALEYALNLLKMTPHYYHIKKEKRDVLDTLEALDVTIDIKVTVYRP